VTEQPDGLADLDGILRRRQGEPAGPAVPAGESLGGAEQAAAQALGQAGLTRSGLRQAAAREAGAEPAATPSPIGTTPRVPTPPVGVGAVAGAPHRRSVSAGRAAFPSVTVMGANTPPPPATAVPLTGGTSQVADGAPTRRSVGAASVGSAGQANPAGATGQHGTASPSPAWRSVSHTHPPAAKTKKKRRVGAAIVGVIGELLITMGLLLGLYVAWELGWTTVEAHRHVEAIVKTEVLTRPEWIIPETTSPWAPLHTEAPPVDEDPLAVPEFGEIWAVLHVPRWGYDYRVPIVEGVDREKILNQGLIGHYPGTQGVGEIGNFATSAHRTTYGAPYNRVAELQVGDQLIVETDRYYFVYNVYDWEIVYPHEVRVIWPVPNEEGATPTKRIMTITTCHPMYSAKQRYIVWGELAYWADKSEGQLEDLVPPADRAAIEQGQEG
jgi:sortase A